MGLRRNKKDGADSVQEIPAHQLIAHFMSASVCRWSSTYNEESR